MAPQDVSAKERLQLEHHFLDKAKWFAWDEVKVLLTETSDLINVQPCGRWSALHQAAYEGNSDMVRYLLDCGADPYAVSGKGETVRSAAQGCAVETLDQVLNQRQEESQTAPKQDVACGGPDMTVTATLATSGEVLATVHCNASSNVAGLGCAIAAHDDEADSTYYKIFLEGGQDPLSNTMTLADAGVVDGCTVAVVRLQRPPGTEEVAKIEDAWRHDPGTRYPVSLCYGGNFYSTPDCKHEDEVRFSNIDFGGGFQRRFVNDPAKERDFSQPSLNYATIFETTTHTLHIIPILASEARFGGIVIEPADKNLDA